MAWIIPLIKPLWEIGERLINIFEPIAPFRIEPGVSGNPPTIFLSILNRSKTRPVTIHSVRIHYGMRDMSTAFVLEPSSEPQTIPADAGKEFTVPTSPPIKIRRIMVTKISKKQPDGVPLNLESPGHLVAAIINGKRRDSWIEVDYNTKRKRRFGRGRIQFVVRRARDLAISRRQP